ncbi:peptide chain release factor N(5)-glutamine methyltransferase [Thiomicrolovo sp. ZZH C-3]
MEVHARPLRECLDRIAAEIAVSAERPRREAERMLMEYLGRDGLWLITHQDAPVDCDERLWGWVKRRKAHEPLEYIFNRVSFYSQLFYIAPGALIPRPETELLIDHVLEAVERDSTFTLCEVGVGSGAVSVTLALHLEQARMIGVDISADALGVAAKNVTDFGLDERIELRQSDLLANVPEEIDVLVSNPPYVAVDAALERNLDYEPDLALFGGVTGMDIIVRLIDAVATRKIPLFCCEMGYDQREAVSAIVPEGYGVAFYKDLAGLDRGFIMTRKDEI